MTAPSSPRSVSLGARLNLFALSIARNWIRIVLVFLGVYVSLPWIAPTFMRLGLEGPAGVIYTMYRPMCHQFAFRTFFLYGEQPVYPLAEVVAATGSDLQPLEYYVGRSRIPLEMRANLLPQPPFDVEVLPFYAGVAIPDDIASTANISRTAAGNFADFQLRSAQFVGNPQMGYKMTICERDIAIYTALFVGALIYSVPRVRRRLRPIPLWLFFILGVAPIGIDGFSQWFGYPPIQLWPVRETAPVFRVLTGALFGISVAWLGFPHINDAMRDTQHEIEDKLRSAGYEV